jgi:uncharacterized protein DUF6600
MLAAASIAWMPVHAAPIYEEAPYDEGPDSPYYSDSGDAADYEAAPDYREQAGPPLSADAAFFYEDLAPYGEWIPVGGHGWVWRPSGVSRGWRPYTDGRWVWTEDGWTWLSDWEWGWAPFHYGRWLFDGELGWVWVPGREWAPAWVEWRYGDGWIGWAPLPPRVVFRREVGLSPLLVEQEVILPPSAFCFVEERIFLEPRIERFIVPASRNVTIVNVTQNVTNLVVVNNRVVNRSIDVAQIERRLQRPVPRFRIVDRDSPAQVRGERIRGSDIAMFRPPPAAVVSTGASRQARTLRRFEGGGSRRSAPPGAEQRPREPVQELQRQERARRTEEFRRREAGGEWPRSAAPAQNVQSPGPLPGPKLGPMPGPTQGPNVRRPPERLPRDLETSRRMPGGGPVPEQRDRALERRESDLTREMLRRQEMERRSVQEQVGRREAADRAAEVRRQESVRQREPRALSQPLPQPYRAREHSPQPRTPSGATPPRGQGARQVYEEPRPVEKPNADPRAERQRKTPRAPGEPDNGEARSAK